MYIYQGKYVYVNIYAPVIMMYLTYPVIFICQTYCDSESYLSRGSYLYLHNYHPWKLHLRFSHSFQHIVYSRGTPLARQYIPILQNLSVCANSRGYHWIFVPSLALYPISVFSPFLHSGRVFYLNFTNQFTYFSPSKLCFIVHVF